MVKKIEEKEKTQKIKTKKITKEKVKETVKKEKSYLEAMGKRKRAMARVRITENGKDFFVNEKKLEDYFSRPDLQEKAVSPLFKMKLVGKFGISAKIKGGGIVSQSEALGHGISRCLVMYDPEFRKKLRKLGLLTRDPRKRERKKFGLKRARRARQWRKR